MAKPTIQIVIEAVADKAEQTLNKAGDALDKLKKKADKATGDDKPLSFFEKLGGAAKDSASNGLGPLGDAIESLGGDLGALSGPQMAAAAGIAALGTAAVASVKQYTALADRVRQFRDASGLSTEEASRLLAVLDDLGINTDTAASAMTRFARNIDAGKLAEYNIEVERNADGTVNMAGTLGNVADTMNSLDDPTRRAAIGTELLGKSYATLSPLLQLGSDGIKEWTDDVSDAQVLTDKNLATTREFALAIDQLTESGTDLGLVAGQELVPVLSLLAKYANAAAGEFSGATNESGGLMTALKGYAVTVFPLYRDALIEAQKATQAQALETERARRKMSGYYDTVGLTAAAGNKLRQSTAELKEEEEKQAQAAKEAADAERERAAATREAQRANDEAAKAIEAERNALLGLFSQELSAERSRKAFAKSTEELSEATDDYDEKLANAKDSALSNAAAQVALAKQTAESKGAGYDAAAAQRDFRGALIEMRDAAGDDNLRQYLDDRIAQLDRAESAGYRAGGGLAYAAQKAREFALEVGANVIPGFGIATPADRLRVPGNADGGNVTGGVPTMVGEAGPELFVPQSNGRILTADDLARVGGGGNGGVTIVVNSPIGRPDDVVRWMREELRRLDRGQR